MRLLRRDSGDGGADGVGGADDAERGETVSMSGRITVGATPYKPDVAEVVRCKDCYQSAVIDDVFYCTYWGKNTDENGYCHEGG